MSKLENKGIKISPSILSADICAMGAEVARLEQAGADLVHVDIMDGVFVPQITFGQNMVRNLKKHTSLPLDVHLMVANPDTAIDSFIEAGADIVTVHAEASVHLQRTLSRIRELGAIPGVSLNPATPLSVVEHVLDDIGLLLIMTVNPGFGGQKFIPAMREKIRRARKLIEGRDIMLELDGGVGPNNAAQLVEDGATVLVSGNAVFTAPDMAAAMRQMRGEKA